MGHGGATISLYVLCADRCLCCLKIVACRERDMAYATILVRFVYFITGIDTGTADEESWEGGARITGCLILLCRCDTAIVTTMLAPSGDRAVPALFNLLYGHHDACSKWRQGGARITGCLIFVCRYEHSELLYCYHNTCSNWRQGGARIV